ncbi:hypothetical protein OOT00_13340 [Desulfobotulus sp. H1]|uniref:DUF1828 domain-containing protein n=1 Tax=Desulfobotulus pelophilus TaxID=2823377 RepID=A0ABT3NBX3_9BACT|nr:hypothetical protein [Desulfobotulus pelophilus]MCW7754970.1 hypothetical protein [Desulfobotulus pelophilus]
MSIHTCVNPGRGVDSIPFGSDEKFVVASLGLADFTDLIKEKTLGSTKVLYYFDRGITFYFDEEDGYRLGCIEVEGFSIFMFDQNVARISKEELKNVLRKNGIEDWYEDNDEEQEALTSDSLAATFYFEFNTLISVQIGVCTDQEENPIWP